MKKVYAIQDNDGHWYIIPIQLKDDFISELDNGESDEWESFNLNYGHFMTGGDLNLVQLYAEI